MRHIPEQYIFESGDIVASTVFDEVIIRVSGDLLAPWRSSRGVSYVDDQIQRALAAGDGWFYVGNRPRLTPKTQNGV